jgi:hypothetical protein
MMRSALVRRLLVSVCCLLVWSATGMALAVPVVNGSLQIRLDAKTVTEIAGQVAVWNDLSPSGLNSFGQAAPGLQPVRATGVVNGQPAVNFTSDQLNAVAGHTLNSASALPFTFFAVGTGATNSVGLFDSAPAQPNVFRFYNANQIELWSSNPVLGVTPDTAGIVYSVRASLPANRQLEVREFRSASAASNSASGVDASPVVFGNPALGSINGGGAGFYAGGIAEVLYYNTLLSDAARNLTENYLAARYDRTLLVSNDFYAGRTAGNGNYDFDVIGIGKESNGAVIASPANEGGALLLNEANGSLDNGDYLLAGNNGTTHALTPFGDGERWSRAYYLDKTGSLDATLTFDFSEAGLAFPTPPVGYTVFDLLYSSDGTNFGALGIPGTSAGNQVSFLLSNAQLQDGFYTLAFTNVAPEPSTAMLFSLGSLFLVRRRRNFKNPGLKT